MTATTAVLATGIVQLAVGVDVGHEVGHGEHVIGHPVGLHHVDAGEVARGVVPGARRLRIVGRRLAEAGDDQLVAGEALHVAVGALGVVVGGLLAHRQIVVHVRSRALGAVGEGVAEPRLLVGVVLAPPVGRGHGPLEGVLARARRLERFLHAGVVGGADIILMCTDGLSNMVEDEELFHIVQGSRDIVEAGEMLVEAAKENGGTDNIGVVLFEPFADEVSV